jgi:hypothetical protein
VSRSVNRDVNERPVGHTSGHARHDRLLIVRFAAGEAEGPDNEQARALIDQCRDCARLAADMTTLRSSMAALPTAKRTRDFRLTPDQAEQLRGSAFDRFLRRLAVPKLGILRPVAGVAVALGITLFVVGAGLPGQYLPAAGLAGAPPAQMLEQDAASPSQREAPTVAQPRPAASSESAGGIDTLASPAATGMPASAPSESVKTSGQSDYAITAAPTATATAAALLPVATATAQPAAAVPAAAADGGDTARLLMVYGGVTIAVIAFGILLLSLYARRRTEDPLLR